MYWNGEVSNLYWEVRGKEANRIIEFIACLKFLKMCPWKEKGIRQLYSKQLRNEVGKRVGNFQVLPYASLSVVVYLVVPIISIIHAIIIRLPHLLLKVPPSVCLSVALSLYTHIHTYF